MDGSPLFPRGADLILRTPEAYGQTGKAGSAQRGGLANHGTDGAASQNVGLELHEEVVGAGAAVHAQGAEADAGILLHGADHIGHLIGNGFQRGADDMLSAGAAGQTHDGAAGIHIPVGSTQTGEGGSIQISTIL